MNQKIKVKMKDILPVGIIIDVDELPTENISESKLYRTPEKKIYHYKDGWVEVGNDDNNLECIKDVTELPKVGWSGTTVPNSGYVEKVYFNTNLSTEEVTLILTKFVENGGLVVLSDDKLLSDPDNGVGIFAGAGEGQAIINISYNDGVDEDVDHMIFNNGWNLDEIPTDVNDGIILNCLAVNYIEGFGDVGLQNNLLSSLISTTPFVKEEEPNDKCVYRLNKTVGWKGTPVDANTKRIYFNTDLSGDEVNNIIDELLSKTGITTAYNLISFEDGNYNLVVEKGKIGDNYDGKIYFENGEWVIENDYVDYNYEVVDEVGNYNDLLSSLISSTPFEEEISSTYHIYKDGKWTQLSDTYNPQIFTEVDELPSLGRKPVPNEGYIGRIYFNKSLGYNGLKEIVTTYDTSGADDLLYPIVCNDDNSKYLTILYNEISGEVNIYKLINNEQTSIASGGENTFSWNSEFTDDYFDFNDTSVNELQGVQIGQANDKLTNFISLESFTSGGTGDTANIDEVSKKIYKLKEVKTSWGETAVPSSGLVEKVYFNTNLSIDEVKEIMKGLEYYTNADLGLYRSTVVFVLQDLSSVVLLSHYKGTEDTSQENYIIGVQKADEYQIIFGWNNITGEESIGQDGWKGISSVEINAENAIGVFAPQLGYTIPNEKIAKLISVTPFKYKEDITYSYHAYNGKEYVRLDGGEDNTSSEVVITKEIPYGSNTITLTQEEFNLIYSNDNAKLIVTQKISDTDSVKVILIKNYNLNAPSLGPIGFTLSSTKGGIFGATTYISFSSTSLSAQLLSEASVTSRITPSIGSTSGTLGIELAYRYDGEYWHESIPLDEEPFENSQNPITSGGVFNALQDTLKKTDVKFGEQDAGFSIGEVEGSGDKNLFFDATNKKWRYCDTSYEDELTNDDNEIATVGDINTVIGDINSILDAINGEEV